MFKEQVLEDAHVQTALGIIDDEHKAATGTGEIEFLLCPDDIMHDDNSLLKLEVVSRAFRGAKYPYTPGLNVGSRLLCMLPSHYEHTIPEKSVFVWCWLICWFCHMRTHLWH